MLEYAAEASVGHREGESPLSPRLGGSRSQPGITRFQSQAIET